jgi:hypothetical protein
MIEYDLALQKLNIAEARIRRMQKELDARAEIVCAIVRAKRQLGVRPSQMKVSFFKEIWPDILAHLEATGYKWEPKQSGLPSPQR